MPIERDDPGVVGPLRAGPGDALVGVLLGDDGAELTGDAADLGHPVRVGVIGLLDHAMEMQERLELGPLVVGGRDRNGHVDGLTW